MKTQKVSVIQSSFQQKVAKHSDQYVHKRLLHSGFESGPECGGPASVSELVMNRQDCTKTDSKQSTF